MLRTFMTAAIIVASCSTNAAAQTTPPDYIYGTVTGITGTKDGLMINMNGSVPTNCAGSAFGWMLIKHDHSEMVSLVLSYMLSNRKKFTVYTDTISPGSFCVVNQVSPFEP